MTKEVENQKIDHDLRRYGVDPLACGACLGPGVEWEDFTSAEETPNKEATPSRSPEQLKWEAHVLNVGAAFGNRVHPKSKIAEYWRRMKRNPCSDK